MKRLFIVVIALCFSGLSWAQELNRTPSLTVWVNALGFLTNQASAAVEYRFTSNYSVVLGATYAYGGRATRPEGNFWALTPAVKVFNDGLQSAHDNWYSEIFGEVRFLQASVEPEYGVGAGFGYARSISRFVLNPELTSGLRTSQGAFFAFGLNTGVLVN